MAKELSDMTPEELVTEVEGARSRLSQVNAESAGRRKQIEAFEKEKADKEKAALSDTEKFQAEIKQVREQHETLQKELKAERVRTALFSRANELNFANPEDAIALTDMSAVEVAADGKVTGFEKSMEALAKDGRLPMKDQPPPRSMGTPPGDGNRAPGKGRELPPVKIRV